jgi:hypothetical protein
VAYNQSYIIPVQPELISDPLTKTTDARPVYFTQNLAGLDTIGKTSETRAAIARVFPYPIRVESRRRKLQRFLDLPQLTLTLIWFPLIAYWLTTYCSAGQTISIAIDRSQWGCINLFTLALIWHKRAIPLYWCLLPKLGLAE